MKVLLCGSSGLLGRELSKILDDNNIDYIGTYNVNKIKKSIKVNFFDLNELEKIIIDINPTICVNSIVERRVEICDSDWNLTKKTNIEITNNLVKICSKLNIHFIHISTDYVFDGKNAPYYPDSNTNPLQNYGISKLISEMKVISNTQNYSIIRVPVLYTDDIYNFEENAVTLIGKKVLNRIEISKEDNYSIRRPNYIPDFCYFILDLIKNPKTGIYHYCNPIEKISKYEISKLISNILHKNHHILPINQEPNDGVERPKDTFLKDNKYDIYQYQFTPLLTGLEKCFSKIYHPILNFNNDLNTKDIFFMIDLDGTLINTDIVHFNAYKEALKEYNYDLDYSNFDKILNNEGIDVFLKNTFETKIDEIKVLKNQILKKTETIELVKNSDVLINYISNFNINHVVVTNTSRNNVNFFKEKVPILNKLKNWVVREDYFESKPNSECYIYGQNKFYNNEKYIIGIENTINGYSALSNLTKCIYMITDINNYNYNQLKKKDVYLINDYMSLFE
jgi:S-adenosylmethionine synthetase